MSVGEETRRYHLGELEIALSTDDPRRVMPELTPTHRRILDIGCGAGQTLIGLALTPEIRAIGVDPDIAALELGREWAPSIPFVSADAEALPFPDGAFDLVISRVAVPYMHIPVALREMHRVLAPGGRLWVTLHPPRMMISALGRSLRSMNVKASAFHLYVLLNGLAFHLTGRLLRWPLAPRRYESVQTRRAIMRSLRQAGFATVDVRDDRHFVVIAERSTGQRPPVPC